MREFWVNVYADNQRALSTKTTWSRTPDFAAWAVHENSRTGHRRPLYRIHVKLKEGRA